MTKTTREEERETNINVFIICIMITFAACLLVACIFEFKINNLQNQLEEMPEWVCEETRTQEPLNITRFYSDEYSGNFLINCVHHICVVEIVENNCEWKDNDTKEEQSVVEEKE